MIPCYYTFSVGNDLISSLTNEQVYVLRIDLDDFEGNTRFAEYGNFIMHDESRNYYLILGDYSGNAGG